MRPILKLNGAPTPDEGMAMIAADRPILAILIGDLERELDRAKRGIYSSDDLANQVQLALHDFWDRNN